ncbi:MAG: hypothetical protein ACREJB_16360 [Planctomycetaceae bacterium]
MKFARTTPWPQLALLACGLLPLAGTGCQATIGGQTLPSAYYLRDDVQFFPAGPEFLLPNQVRVLEEYRIRQEAIEEGLAAPLPPVAPVPPPGLPGGPPGGPPVGQPFGPPVVPPGM